MHNAKEASFRNNCRMMLGVSVDSRNTSSNDATIAPIDGVETKNAYNVLYFNNGIGILQRVK